MFWSSDPIFKKHRNISNNRDTSVENLKYEDLIAACNSANRKYDKAKYTIELPALCTRNTKLIRDDILYSSLRKHLLRDQNNLITASSPTSTSTLTSSTNSNNVRVTFRIKQENMNKLNRTIESYSSFKSLPILYTNFNDDDQSDQDDTFVDIQASKMKLLNRQQDTSSRSSTSKDQLSGKKRKYTKTENQIRNLNIVLNQAKESTKAKSNFYSSSKHEFISDTCKSIGWAHFDKIFNKKMPKNPPVTPLPPLEFCT